MMAIVDTEGSKRVAWPITEAHIDASFPGVKTYRQRWKGC